MLLSQTSQIGLYFFLMLAFLFSLSFFAYFFFFPG